jgi:hypothetical protein
MDYLNGQQLSLIAELESDDLAPGDWDYEKLGTKENLVPNFPPKKLGTYNLLVPSFPPKKLGTEISLVPNFAELDRTGSPSMTHTQAYEPLTLPPRWDEPTGPNYKPQVGCLDRKWIKSHQYYCWRYYDKSGKKRSIHLGKDYNKAVRRCIKIGVPYDAKLPKHANTKTNSQTPPHP